MSDNLKSKGTSSFLWDIIGKFVNSGIGFILTLFLARLLEPSEFGLIAIVLVFLGFMSVFFDAGLSASLIQRKRVLPVHYSSVFYFNMIVATVLTLLVFMSAEKIADFYGHHELIYLLQVMSVSFLLGALSSVQRVQLQKELNYKLLAKVTMISTTISGLLGVFLAYRGAGVWSLVVQNLAFGVITNSLLWKISDWRPSLSFSLKALKYLWRFGFHVFLVSIMNAIFGRLDVLVAGKLVSPTVLGFYDRAKHLNQMVYSYSAGSLISVLFPVLSKVKNDLFRFQNIVIKIYALLSFGVFLLIGGFYVTSNELIMILFSEKWLASVVYFKIIVLAVFSPIYGALLTNVLTSRGKSKRYLHIDIYKKILMAINLYIGFSFGLNEYLYGYVLVALLIFVIDLYNATQELKLSIDFFIKATTIQLLIGVVSVYIITIITDSMDYNYFIMFFGKGVGFVAVYIILSGIIQSDAWKYTKEEILLILKKRKICL